MRLTERFDMLLRNVVDQSISPVEQVLSNSREVDEGLDSVVLQQIPIADPREFQELRCLERALKEPRVRTVYYFPKAQSWGRTQTYLLTR